MGKFMRGTHTRKFDNVPVASNSCFLLGFPPTLSVARLSVRPCKSMVIGLPPPRVRRTQGQVPICQSTEHHRQHRRVVHPVQAGVGGEPVGQQHAALKEKFEGHHGLALSRTVSTVARETLKSRATAVTVSPLTSLARMICG